MVQNNKIFSAILLLFFIALLTVINVLHVPKTIDPREEDKINNIIKEYDKEGLMDNSILTPLPPDFSFLGNITFEAGSKNSFMKNLPKKDWNKSTPLTKSDTYMTYVLELMTKGTQYEGKAQINKLPKQGYINLYFLRDDPRILVKNFKNNCVYIGYSNIIICDSIFVNNKMNEMENYQHLYDIAIWTEGETSPITDYGKMNNEQRRIAKEMIKTGFLVWFIGHEIGHVIKHSEYISSTHNPRYFDNAIYNKMESEADDYVSNMLTKSPMEANIFYLSILEFVHQEYRSIYAKSNKIAYSKLNSELEAYEFPLRTQIKIRYSKYNIPPIIRAVRVLENLVEHTPNLDETGFITKIKHNIILEDTSISSSAYSILILFLFCLILLLRNTFIKIRRANI